jgi:hypothetical protein
METASFQIPLFGGMDERWNPDPNLASVAQDLRWDERGGWDTAGGYRELVNDSEGSSPYSGEGQITSLHWFAQHNGARQWLVYETNGGKLRHFNGSTAPAAPWSDIVDYGGLAYNGTNRSRTTLTTPWQGTQSQVWGGRLYLVNGIDEPLVFNGEYADRAGFSSRAGTPSAGPVSTSSGDGTSIKDQGLGVLAAAGSTRECGYRYKVTFVNERGQESPASDAAQASFENGPTNKLGCTVQLPVGLDSVVARRVYRTRNTLNSDGEPFSLGYAEEFYFLTEIQDNISETFEDWVPDPNLGALLDETSIGPWPMGVKFLAVFKNTMFASGTSDNHIRYSAPNFPEVFPADNILPIGDGDGGQIMGLYPTKNALVAFKQRGIYLIKGDPLNGFYAETLTQNTGCSAPGSIQELPGLGVVFLSEDGLHLLKGALENTGTPTETILLSTPIPETIERINRSAMLNVRSAVLHREREYWLAVPFGGNSNSTDLIIFHYDVGHFTTRPSFPVKCMVETRDHRGYLIFGSHDDSSTAGLWVYSAGWGNKNGVAIQPRWMSTTIDLGSVYKAIRPRYLLVQGVSYGNNDLTVDYRVDRGSRFHRSELGVDAQGQDQQDDQILLPVYGTAVWGTDRWKALRPVTMRFDILLREKGLAQELQFQLEPASGSRMQIIGCEVRVAVGEQNNVLPLNPDVTGLRR